MYTLYIFISKYIYIYIIYYVYSPYSKSLRRNCSNSTFVTTNDKNLLSDNSDDNSDVTKN